MKTILLTLLIFAVIILIHEGGHFTAAKLCGVKVDEFSIGMGPSIFHFEKKETKYSLRLLPIGGYVSMEGEDDSSEDPRSFFNQAVWKRIVIVVAGAVMNLILGFIIVLLLTASKEKLASTTIAGFSDGATTQSTGLQVGDQIVSINGRSMWVETDILYALSADSDGIVDMVVRRDGEKVHLQDVSFTMEDGTIMIDFSVVGVSRSFGSVTSYAFRKTASIGRLIWISLGQLITGEASVSDLSGPIGTAQAVGQASKAGMSTFFNLCAFITINVGIFNLLPLPALDGGKLFFLLIEAVTGHRIDPKYETVVNFIGFILVFALLIFVSFQDIVNLIHQ